MEQITYTSNRLKLLKIALVFSGKTMETVGKEWGVTRQMVHQVASGKFRSDRLTAEIDKFIAEKICQLKQYIN